MNREISSGSELLELYTTYGHEIAKAKGRDRLWKLPFFGVGMVNLALPAYGLISGNQDFLKLYNNYLVLPGFLSLAAGFGISFWGSGRQRFTHINDLAVQIAEVEGRVAADPEAESRRAYQVMSSARFLKQGGLAHSERFVVWNPQYNNLSRHLQKAQVRMLDTQENLVFKQWEIFLNSSVDKTLKKEIRLSSLKLADLWWEQIANDIKNPYDQRKYAYQMRNKIRQQLSKSS